MANIFDGMVAAISNVFNFGRNVPSDNSKADNEQDVVAGDEESAASKILPDAIGKGDASPDDSGNSDQNPASVDSDAAVEDESAADLPDDFGDNEQAFAAVDSSANADLAGDSSSQAEL